MSVTTELLSEEIQMLREKIVEQRAAGQDVSHLEEELQAKSFTLSEAVAALHKRRVLKG